MLLQAEESQVWPCRGERPGHCLISVDRRSPEFYLLVHVEYIKRERRSLLAYGSSYYGRMIWPSVGQLARFISYRKC